MIKTIKNTIGAIRKLVIVLLIATSSIGAYRLYQKVSIENGIGHLLGLAMPGEFTTIILGRQRIQEYANVRVPMVVQGFSLKGAWPLDSKMTIQGMYVAKIGFDLSERFQLDVDALSKSIYVVLPVPTVLSVERQDLTVLGHDQSFLTSMTPEELAVFFSAMDKHAKESIASNETALSGAVEDLRGDIERFGSIYGYTVDLSVYKKDLSTTEALTRTEVIGDHSQSDISEKEQSKR